MQTLLTEVNFLFDDLVRPPLDLIKKGADILAKYAQKDELDSAEDRYENGQCCPARRPGAIRKIGDDSEQGRCEAEKRKENTNVDCSLQRPFAEGDNTVSCKLK